MRQALRSLSLGIGLSCLALAGVAADVYTRGQVRSTFQEQDGARTYVRLKLLAGMNLPFTTLTYRVPPHLQVEGLRQGAVIDFRAERIAGVNTITEIRPPVR